MNIKSQLQRTTQGLWEAFDLVGKSKEDFPGGGHLE